MYSKFNFLYYQTIRKLNNYSIKNKENKKEENKNEENENNNKDKEKR